MGEQRAKVDVPWYLVVLVTLVVISSAILATVGIGGAHAALELPALLTFALPPVAHFAAVMATWDGVRSTDPRRQRAAKQGLLGIAAVFIIVGAITTQLRLGRWDIPALLISGLVSGAGPLTLALIFFPSQNLPSTSTIGDEHDRKR